MTLHTCSTFGDRSFCFNVIVPVFILHRVCFDAYSAASLLDLNVTEVIFYQPRHQDEVQQLGDPH